MKAIVQRGYGSPDVLGLEEIDAQVPKDDEVLVRVRAASINHADRALTTGVPYVLRLAAGLRRPRMRVRCQDVAGVVEAVGKRVTQFLPGDEVYAEVVGGALAEYASVPENMLALKPSGLTFEQAAAVPLAGNTAHQGLRDAGRLQPGQRVLINGASGGVGTFAVQIAKAFGADVTGVCRTRNVDLVRSLGADRVIDYIRKDFAAQGRQYDLIFDIAGSRSSSDCRRASTPAGRLVLSSAAGGGRVLGPLFRFATALATSPLVRQDLRVLAATRSKPNLDALRGLIESGAVTPAIDRTYPLGETPDALRYFSEEHARAKIVISI